MNPKNLIIKNIVTFISLLAFLSSFNNYAYAVMIDDRNGQPRQSGAYPAKNTHRYVAGEVLVKFREGADPEAVLRSSDIYVSKIDRVYSIKSVVNSFRKRHKFEKAASGRYVFSGKEYGEMNDVPDEEIFKEAYKQMPDIEKGLYRNYKITLPGGMRTEEAVNSLKNNPDVEYAELNGIVTIF